MVELYSIERSSGFRDRRRARWRERAELVPVLEEETRLVELGHVVDDARELPRELLARGDGRACFRDADAALDHEIRQRAIGERGHERGRAGAHDLVTGALAQVRRELLQALVGEPFVQGPHVRSEGERPQLLCVLTAREETEDVVALAFVRGHRSPELIGLAAARRAREPHWNEADYGEHEEDRLEDVEGCGDADDEKETPRESDRRPGNSHHPPHRVHRSAQKVLEFGCLEALQVDRDDSIEQDRVRVSLDDR